MPIFAVFVANMAANADVPTPKLGEIMNFEAVLAEIQANPKPLIERDPKHTLKITSKSGGRTVDVYDVVLPAEFTGTITDTELITRCDNRGEATDLRNEPGKVCHFGGKVTKLGDTRYEVSVFID